MARGLIISGFRALMHGDCGGVSESVFRSERHECLKEPAALHISDLLSVSSIDRLKTQTRNPGRKLTLLDFESVDRTDW
jgi:hypothetical protein